ncbi:MAG: TRAP transporter small permease [Sneathiellaceae bacterium]
MSALVRAYDWLITALAVLAGAMLFVIALVVALQILLREIAVQAPDWLFTSVEFGLLYLTMLSVPWLMRARGHIYIEILTASVPDRVRHVISRLVAAGAAIVCAVLTWYSIDFVAGDIATAKFDWRAPDIPRAWVSISLPIGFGLLGIECLRYVFGREILHTGEIGIHE